MIKGARGKGLLLAIELDLPAMGREPGPDFERHMLAALRKEGVSTVFKGGSSISFSPPLVISEAEIVDTLERIGRAVQAVS